jgi:HemY protein
MKFLVIVLFILLAATSIALVVQEDPGFVMFRYGEWTLETSLAVLLAAVILGYGAFYFLLRFLLFVLRLPRHLREYSRARRAEHARRSLHKGLIELAEGRWTTAERLLTRHAADSDNPLINYLSAARAAQQLGAHARRDEHLRLAHEHTSEADIAVGLTQAELQLAHRQSEQALATLTRLHGIAPKHAYVLKLLARLYEQLGDWEQLAATLPELRRRKVLPENRLDELERSAYVGRLELAARKSEASALEAVWEAMPKQLREDDEMFLRYIDALRHKEAALGGAEQLLRTRLDKHWNESLVRIYAELELADPARQIQHAEVWLKEHAHSPGLLYTLGRLCVRNRIWGKARSYYEASIGISPSVEAYLELGELLEQHIGDPNAARDCYRKGLELALQRDATTATPRALPAPGAHDTRRALTDRPSSTEPVVRPAGMG